MSAQSQPVEVEILVPLDFRRSGQGTLRLLIEDVSEADAPARKIAEKILPEVTVLPGKHFTLTAEVPLDAIDPRRSYNVRVHLSMKGANTVQVGDLISTQSLPVLTHGHPSRVAVSLREVR